MTPGLSPSIRTALPAGFTAGIARRRKARSWAKTENCRVRHMLDYFGEPGPERCGRCDNCRAAGFGVAAAAVEEEEAEPAAGDRKRKRRRRGRRRRGEVPAAAGGADATAGAAASPGTAEGALPGGPPAAGAGPAAAPGAEGA